MFGDAVLAAVAEILLQASVVFQCISLFFCFFFLEPHGVLSGRGDAWAFLVLCWVFLKLVLSFFSWVSLKWGLVHVCVGLVSTC